MKTWYFKIFRLGKVDEEPKAKGEMILRTKDIQEAFKTAESLEDSYIQFVREETHTIFLKEKGEKVDI